MTKLARMKAVNVLLALLLAVTALTGILHGHLGTEAFTHVHVPCGLLLLVLSIVHLVLNWSWVKANLFR